MGSFFRDDPPDPPDIPPPPEPQEILDVIDEISGTKMVTVTGADGKKRRVVSKLPRTPQEDAFFKQGEELMASSLRNLKTLYAQNPSQVVDFSPIVKTFADINKERMTDLGQIANFGNIAKDVEDFKVMQDGLVTQEYDRLNRAAEQKLAERGHYNSTAGDAFRSQLIRDQGLARQQADVNARLYGDQLAGAQLNRNAQAFGLREQGRQGRLQGAQSAYGLEQQQKADLDQAHQRQVGQELSKLEIGSGLRASDNNKAMQTKAPGIALNEFNAVNQDAMNRYNANVNAIASNYQNQLGHYNAKPPGFMESITDLGLSVGGMALGSYLGGGGIGSALGGAVGAGSMGALSAMSAPSFTSFTPSVMYPGSNMLKFASANMPVLG